MLAFKKLSKRVSKFIQGLFWCDEDVENWTLWEYRKMEGWGRLKRLKTLGSKESPFSQGGHFTNFNWALLSFCFIVNCSNKLIATISFRFNHITVHIRRTYDLKCIGQQNLNLRWQKFRIIDKSIKNVLKKIKITTKMALMTPLRPMQQSTVKSSHE